MLTHTQSHTPYWGGTGSDNMHRSRHTQQIKTLPRLKSLQLVWCEFLCVIHQPASQGALLKLTDEGFLFSFVPLCLFKPTSSVASLLSCFINRFLRLLFPESVPVRLKWTRGDQTSTRKPPTLFCVLMFKSLMVWYKKGSIIVALRKKKTFWVVFAVYSRFRAFNYKKKWTLDLFHECEGSRGRYQ